MKLLPLALLGLLGAATASSPSFPLHAPRGGRASLRLRGGSPLLGCFGGGEALPEPLILSKEVTDAPEVEGEGKPRRNARWPDLVGLPFADKPELDTPFATFKSSAERWPDAKCLGHRAYLDSGKRGDYIWQSYGEVLKQATAFGAGLSKVCGVQKGGKCGIYSVNRPEWTASMLGMWSHGHVCVPLYDSVGVDAVRFIVNHAALPLVVCQRSKLQTLLDAGKECRSLKHIVLIEDLTEEDTQLVNSVRKDLKLTCISDLVKAGSEAPAGTPHASGDLATVLYTSGTTGDPKGVMLTAGNQLASAAGCFLIDPTYDGKDVASSDYFYQATYVSYLPLAHSFELNMQILVLTTGSAIGFYQGDVRKLVTHDMPLLKPTIMAGVPRVFSRIYDKVMQGLDQKGAVARTLFRAGFSANQRAMRHGKRSALFDAILFKKLQNVLGGNVKIFLTGAAPMSAELHNFIKVTFNAPVVQGYGMTENAGAAMAMTPELKTVGTVGGPIPCTEVKLIDVAEMDYTSKDTYPKTLKEFEAQVSFKGSFDPELAGKPVPRGEVCLRGVNIMQGYLKLECETQAVVDQQGWVHTGDIGQWNSDGSMSIIDRKKNIFKLAQGEYIAVESVENALSKSKYALQCWVYGNSFETCLVAVVAPDQESVMAFCSKAGIQGSLSEVCATDAVQKLIFDDMTACARSSGLRGYECPKAIYIESNGLNELGQAFTVANDCLTPSFKLRRPQLLNKYHNKIDAMYASIRARSAGDKDKDNAAPAA